MKNLITVEWSESQKCFHVDDYETTLMNNMDSFVNGGGNDYQILFITDSREAAYDAVKIFKEMPEYKLKFKGE